VPPREPCSAIRAEAAASACPSTIKRPVGCRRALDRASSPPSNSQVTSFRPTSPRTAFRSQTPDTDRECAQALKESAEGKPKPEPLTAPSYSKARSELAKALGPPFKSAEGHMAVVGGGFRKGF
jgi:hypothetical protein